MRPTDELTERVGTPLALAIVLTGGVVAVWTLFGVGAAVWNGYLPPGTVPVALLVVFLLVAVVMPTPEPDPNPEPHEVWQRELDEDREAWDRDEERWSDDGSDRR